MNTLSIERPLEGRGVFSCEKELLGKLEALVKKVKVYKNSHYYARYNIPEAREEAFKKLKSEFDQINESLWERIIEQGEMAKARDYE